MKRLLLLTICCTFFLVGCSEKAKDKISTDEDVLAVLKEQGIIWEDDNNQFSGGLFSLPLNAVTPTTLVHENEVLTIYTYNTKKERKEAVKVFLEGTKKMPLIEHRMYESKNVLVFYVSYDESASFDKSIEKALNSL